MWCDAFAERLAFGAYGGKRENLVNLISTGGETGMEGEYADTGTEVEGDNPEE